MLITDYVATLRKDLAAKQPVKLDSSPMDFMGRRDTRTAKTHRRFAEPLMDVARTTGNSRGTATANTLGAPCGMVRPL